MTAIKDFFTTILYKPLFNLLAWLVWIIPGHSVGWAIILLTVLVRLALYPSQKKSIESQKRLTEIQPEMDKIKKKYPKDQKMQAEAMMSLYKTHKVNPFSSCLPLLIQLPILIVLYRVFTAGLSTDSYNLLYSFVPHAETISTSFYGLNLSNPNLYLAIVAGVLQFIQSWQMTKSQPKKDPKAVPNQQNMMADFSKQMMYIFPVMTVFIAMKLPAALALYWIITTLFMVVQQYFVYKAKPKKDLKGITVSIKNTKELE